ncbi:hypothetical protein GCM10025868_27730 [Angustibacter aerolatus]|uniref:YCII-related domain-containing protein n=1 Tax=Angustibacter aerolatus TaxID=1162965 RepID=A0ABQ6JH56_9ACTN|nr:hypothetical protein GCM10025868_27730 [Angustibacter aerolatus]
MKYVILIHSNPDPWGHPTSAYTPEGRAVPPEQAAESDRAFDEPARRACRRAVSSSPARPSATRRRPRCSGGRRRGTSPWTARTPRRRSRLAGFFVVDCETRERADAVAARFAGPGSTVEPATDDVAGWRRAVTP